MQTLVLIRPVSTLAVTAPVPAAHLIVLIVKQLVVGLAAPVRPQVCVVLEDIEVAVVGIISIVPALDAQTVDGPRRVEGEVNL